MGQRGITMATNFGTKIAINAYKCISTRDNENVITYNGVFVVDQSKEDISDCKDLRDVAMATNLWPKYHKMATTSVLCVNPCRVWFWHRVCAIGEFIYDTPVHKGQRGVTMATNFGTRIAINAFLRDTTGM